MKILLSINKDLLDNLDTFCAKFGYQRSEFIRNCIRAKIFDQTLQSVGVSTEEITPVTAQLFDKEIQKKTLTSVVAKKILKIAESKSIATCKHGYAFGNCKFGCKK